MIGELRGATATCLPGARPAGTPLIQIRIRHRHRVSQQCRPGQKDLETRSKKDQQTRSKKTCRHGQKKTWIQGQKKSLPTRSKKICNMVKKRLADMVKKDLEIRSKRPLDNASQKLVRPGYMRTKRPWDKVEKACRQGEKVFGRFFSTYRPTDKFIKTFRWGSCCSR